MMKPTGAPSWPSIAYQPRRCFGAFSASKDGRPSQEPPRAMPWPIRNSDSSTIDRLPMLAKLGRKAMPAVQVPSRNRATVSLVLRSQRRWIHMKATVPIGRATNARAKIANDHKVPSSLPRNGKKIDGNTSTEAMP